MTKTTMNRRAAARLLMNKLHTFGLPEGYVRQCARESLAWLRTRQGEALGLKLFFLRRAEYCRKRYYARWGMARAPRHRSAF